MNSEAGPEGRGVKPGAEPTYVDVVCAKRIGPTPDCTLIARSDGVAIWHTDKTARSDVPLWLPPFGWESPLALYRGFPIGKLHNVLESGLDVPPQCAFFATPYPDKAWEYPVGRERVAMLVLDRARAEPSYARKPADADGAWRPDKSLYPNTYVDDGREVHARFEAGRGPGNFRYESMYGHWVPGDARAALFAVVLGGHRGLMYEQLATLRARGAYGLELLR